MPEVRNNHASAAGVFVDGGERVWQRMKRCARVWTQALMLCALPLLVCVGALFMGAAVVRGEYD